LLPGLASCQTRDVLGLKAAEAAGLLAEGNIGFILRSRPSRLDELLFLHPGAAFYAGLVAEEQAAGLEAKSAGDMAEADRAPETGGAPDRENEPGPARRPAVDKDAVTAAASVRTAAELYRVSLKSPSPLVQEAAALKLRFNPRLIEPGDEAGVLRALRKANPASSWEKIYALLNALPREISEWGSKGKRGQARPEAAIRDLAVFFLTAETDDPYRWGWAAINQESLEGALGGGEAAGITGRLAVSRLSFDEALVSFRETLERNENLFLRCPALLNGLGRTFQFTSAGAEGAALFRQWETRLKDGDIQDAAPETPYLLAYFTGRVERQQGRYAQAAAAFTRALALAPDGAQEDACMWYILNITQSNNPESFIPLFKTYLPRWHSAAYFEDILERQARYFAANRQWDRLLEVYSLFPENSGWAVRGQYAYLLGRAASLGFLGKNGKAERDDAGEAGNPAEQAKAFFTAAREEQAALFYYRALAGNFLDAPPLSLPGEEDEKTAPSLSKERDMNTHPDKMEFLLGFFQYAAAAHIDPYLQNMREELTTDELRVLAEAFQSAGRWKDAIRLAVFYMNREGYEFDRRDLELAHPRPFRDLTENYAREAEIPPALLYGLIRTESAFDPAVRSWAGAEGLTQLMNATALDMAGRLSRRGGPQYVKDGEINLMDPETNIHLGAVYLRYLMNNLKSPMTAVLAYNGGMGRVRRWRAAGSTLPEDLFLETVEIAETRDYGRRVFGAAAVYGYLYYGISMEKIVADIIK
jgi:soluble lytic murein transglycosylase